MELGADSKAVLFAAGVMFFLALLLGVWKYRQMAASPEGHAHPYVDIAHRSALLYSFATLLLATFVELSGWSTAVNLVAAFAVFGFFLFAVLGYATHGIRRDTDNQFRDPMGSELKPIMSALIFFEISGFAVLFAGFLNGQIF
jgi:hypothetical protein